MARPYGYFPLILGPNFAERLPAARRTKEIVDNLQSDIEKYLAKGGTIKVIETTPSPRAIRREWNLDHSIILEDIIDESRNA